MLFFVPLTLNAYLTLYSQSFNKLNTKSKHSPIYVLWIHERSLTSYTIPVKKQYFCWSTNCCCLPTVLHRSFLCWHTLQAFFSFFKLHSLCMSTYFMASTLAFHQVFHSYLPFFVRIFVCRFHAHQRLVVDLVNFIPIKYSKAFKQLQCGKFFPSMECSSQWQA